MKQRIIMAILMTATACAAQVVTLTGYVFQPGKAPATRSPVRSAGGSQFVQIYNSPNQGPVVPGAKGEPVATTTNKVDASKYALGFITVSGGLGGPITIFPDSSGNFPLNVPVDIPNVATATIAVKAFYFPIGGAPCPSGVVCSTGASIDEYSDTQNMLLEDSFVNVSVPPATTPNSGLTSTGNEYGTVDTTNQAVQITAYSTTTTGGAFDRWVEIPGGQLDALPLGVPKHSSPYALAFYHSSCPSGYSWSQGTTVSQCVANAPPNQCQEFLTSLNTQIAQKRVPVASVAGDKAQLKSCLASGQITQAQYNATLGALNALGSGTR